MAAPEGKPDGTASEGRPIRQPGIADMVVRGVIAPSDISVLCRRVSTLLHRTHADLVACDVGKLVHPDLAAIDALARLQLTARREGAEIRLLNADDRLRELLDLAGLCDVVALGAELPLEARGKPEEREQAGGAEEEGDSGDLTI